MVTLQHRKTLVYKYGCSDPRFNNLGGMHLLYWTAIREGCASGLEVFDLGRTDAGQTGLTRFKSRWGAKATSLVYQRFSVLSDASHAFDLPGSKLRTRLAKQVLGRLPVSLLAIIGRKLYKHVG
jgi:hypothetical protein